MDTTTITKLVQTQDLDVEVEISESGGIVVSAWERVDGRLGDALFLSVPGEKLSAAVDAVAAALAPEDPVEAEIVRRGLGPAFGAVR